MPAPLQPLVVSTMSLEPMYARILVYNKKKMSTYHYVADLWRSFLCPSSKLLLGILLLSFLCHSCTGCPHWRCWPVLSFLLSISWQSSVDCSWGSSILVRLYNFLTCFSKRCRYNLELAYRAVLLLDERNFIQWIVTRRLLPFLPFRRIHFSLLLYLLLHIAGRN